MSFLNPELDIRNKYHNIIFSVKIMIFHKLDNKKNNKIIKKRRGSF